jgi:CheY-like chemotaxis protein
MDSIFRPIEILLLEDSPADIRLTRETLQASKLRNTLNVVEDGNLALDYLFQRGPYADAPHPDLILLDLNLPTVDGRDVLRAIKQDPTLKRVPVVVLATSEYETDRPRPVRQGRPCYRELVAHHRKASLSTTDAGR